MADPLHDKDLKEKNLACLMKSPRLIVCNELNTSRVTRCWPQKPLPLHRIPHRSKKIPLKKSISSVLIGSKSICESGTSDTTGSSYYSFLLQNLFSGTHFSVFLRLGKKILGRILGLILRTFAPKTSHRQIFLNL